LEPPKDARGPLSEFGLDLVHDASIGLAVAEVFDDRVSRPLNACGAKFVREFAKRGLVKPVVGAREDDAAFAIEDLHTAERRPLRRDPAFEGVELLLGILVPADRPVGGRRLPLAFALGGGGPAARLAEGGTIAGA
jgi:hypothetical protein